MEMQETCTRPARGPRGGWQESEVEQLWEQVRLACTQGEPLRDVFERVGANLGRKPNSIRNFYYAQLKLKDAPELKRAMPFETFSDDEVTELVKTVLKKKAQGMSVRACVSEMADGDKALMLRYQNKYRSTLKNKPDMVRQIISDVEASGELCADPYMARGARQSPELLLEKTTQRVEQRSDTSLIKMLEGINELLDLASERHHQLEPSTQLSQTLTDRDRLSVRNDLLRIALDDERIKTEQLKSQCEKLVVCIKEFVGQSEFTRAQRVGEFCSELSSHLSTLEQSLPFTM